MQFREVLGIAFLFFLAAGGTERAEAAQCRGTPSISDRFELSAQVERSIYREISVGAYYVFFTHAAGTSHLGFCSRPERVLYENTRVSGIVEELRALAVDTA